MLQLLFVEYGPSYEEGNYLSMHNLISPVFIHTGTKFEIQSENLIGTMIPALNNLFTSFSMDGSSFGLILLNFSLKGF